MQKKLTVLFAFAIFVLVMGWAIKPASADCPHRGRDNHAHCRPDPGKTRLIVTLDGGVDDMGMPDDYTHVMFSMANREVCFSEAFADPMSPGVPDDGVEGLGTADVHDDNIGFDVSFRLERIPDVDADLTNIKWPGRDLICAEPNFLATSGSVVFGRDNDTGQIIEYTFHFRGSSPGATAQTAMIEFDKNPFTNADGELIPSNDLASHITTCTPGTACFIVHLHADAVAVLRRSKFIGTVSWGDLTFSLP